VTIDELITGVNIALDLRPLDVCAAADGDDDGLVAVNELILGVRNSLEGCP
jgi:hypothetical protein